MPTEAIAADTGGQIVIKGILAALFFLDNMIDFPRPVFVLPVLQARVWAEDQLDIARRIAKLTLEKQRGALCIGSGF